MIERLEGRRLFAANLDPTGLLTVEGTAGADSIAVTLRSETVLNGTTPTVVSRVVVRVNTTVQAFPAERVRRVSVFGLAGNDAIEVAQNLNRPVRLDGGIGDDRLFGGNLGDEIFGGAGNDQLSGGGGPDVIGGGEGNDTVTYQERTGNVAVSLDGVANDGAILPAPTATNAAGTEGDNVRVDVENVIGGSGNDVITGSALANRLVGGGGNDRIAGLGGNDVLEGGAGNDRLEGGPGNDRLFGGDGDDLLIARDGLHDLVNGGGGFDRALVDPNNLDEVIGVEAFPTTV